MKLSLGFTLIELMIVIVIIAIIAAIAIPSYQSYVRRADESRSMQEIQRMVVLLERYKARNFSYRNFNEAPNVVSRYNISIFDANGNALTSTSTNGRTWAILATTTDPQNFNLLLTSTGVRCKNKTSFSTYTGCGTGSESW